ncbi:hypothetical protein [Propionivibrio sp.]|uniref:hypothetical protein n=1 Tax=Propionivibrio sp. TaxID=2212460 RepID=UPI003BF5C665
MRDVCIAILLLLLSLSAHAHDAQGCAATIKDLRILAEDPSFALRWSEISMDDGKPLKVSIVERNGALLLEFMKTGEGLWAEISGVICKSGVDLELRMPREQINLGPATNWMLSLALANGGVFTLRRRMSNQLQIETQGWSGRFVPTAMN